MMSDCPRCGGEGCAWCRPLREVHQMSRRDAIDTSRDAAQKVHKKLTKLQRCVLQCFDEHGAMTDFELHQHCCAMFGKRAYSSYMTRRSELTAAGYIRDTGRRVKIEGTARAVWERVNDEKNRG